MKLNRREFLKSAGAAAVMAGLASCGLDPTQLFGRKPGSPVQLVYQDWRTDWFPPLAQEMLDKFNAQHPGIRVFYTPDPDDLADKMSSDMAAGIAPDVFSGCCDFFPAWADAGYLLDLRPYLSDLDKSVTAGWDPVQFKALAGADGKQYGLPKYHGELALFYNKDLFDSRKVDYPTGNWSHDDYLAAMKKLTLKNAGGTAQWGSMFDISWEGIQAHVNGWGGHFVDPANPRGCQMTAAPAQNAMEWLRARMWDDKVMASELDVQNVPVSQAFVTGSVAMVEDGSWSLKDILEGAQFRIGVAPFPAGPQRRVTLVSNDGFCIYAGTKHPDEAWEFLKFLIGSEYSLAMVRYHLLQPASSSLVPQWASLIQLQYPDRSQGLDLTTFVNGQANGTTVTPERFSKMIGVSDAAISAWSRIYTLGQVPVSAMDQVCQQIEALQGSGSTTATSCTCGAAG